MADTAHIDDTIDRMGPNPTYVPSQLNVCYFCSKNIVHFVIVLAVMLIEQKYYACQCSQFVTTASICAYKTLITLNRVLSAQIAVIYADPSY